MSINSTTAQDVISPLDFSLLLFEVRTREGHEFRIHLDGSISGFPDGSIIFNHALPLFCKLRDHHSGCFPREKRPPTVGISDD